MNVIQPWVSDLPMMQQTVLLTAVRGPDTLPKYHPAKFLLRWYRRCILLSAMDGKILTDPSSSNGGSFTGPSCAKPSSLTDTTWQDQMDMRVTDYLRALDEVPLHFHMHLLHAVEIVGYKHPENDIGAWWLINVYWRFVKDLHLAPESESSLNARLGDNRAAWLEHGDEATND